MSTQQIKKDIEEMISRIDEKYEAVYIGDGFNYSYREHGVEAFFASSIRSIFYFIKEKNLYKFWENISYEARIEFFSAIFKDDFFEFFEDMDKDGIQRFLDTIFTHHRFREHLKNAFCGMELKVMKVGVMKDEMKELYDDIVNHLKSLIEDIESYDK